jgi:hypothetical protein
VPQVVNDLHLSGPPGARALWYRVSTRANPLVGPNTGCPFGGGKHSAIQYCFLIFYELGNLSWCY